MNWTRMRRHAVALAVLGTLAGAAQAQTSEGSINGTATANATISIKNLETGLARNAKADASGNFNFSRLPPGRYEISANGVTKEVLVNIGSGSQVRFDDAQQLERITVSGSRIRNAIDLTTSEVNRVFSAEQITALPVIRNPNAIAYLAPGVVQGDEGLGAGKLPSFGGASVGENGYYINGFDVTNIRNFLSYAELPFEAISQQQVKSGGYGAEYGRSLGGVISMVTKRGTNDWKGGASLYWLPSGLTAKQRDVLDLDPSGAEPNSNKPGYLVRESANKYDEMSVNAFIGGPIIKDRLFVFALVEGRNNKEQDFDAAAYRSTVIKSTQPRGMVKLDFVPFDNHSFEYTGIRNKRALDYTDHKRPEDTVAEQSDNWYTTSHSGVATNSERTEGGDVHILKYTGFLTDSLTVSALAGRTTYQQPIFTGARLDGADCPVVYNEGATIPLGCWNGVFPGSPGRDPNAPATDQDKRTAWRFDVEYVLGGHTLRAGVDNQKFVSSEAGGSDYSGGAYWRYYDATDLTRGAGVIGPASIRALLPAGEKRFVRKRTSLSTSGAYEVLNNAWYIEDSWKVDKQLLLYGGLRGESFDNRNGDGVSFVKADNLLAPRFGFAFDLAGDGSTKIYANAGRYYIPVASNTNIRGTRAEGSSESYYTYSGRADVTMAPTGLTQLGTTTGSERLQLPDPATVADTKLRPMNQDELILGFQKALSKQWTVGVKAVHRKVNDGMDDFCGAYATRNYVVDKLNPNYTAEDQPDCVLVNPGRDINVKVDVMNDGKLVEITVPASYTGLAKYQRTYNAVELSLEHPFDGRWSGNFSYTWSKNKGTAEGYVQSNLDQEDAGATQDFDFGSLTDGSNGYLPNDRRHVFKAFGNYALNDSMRLGGNLVVTSGRPVSCIGYVPETVSDFNKVDGHRGSGDYTSASAYYCLDSSGFTKLVPRGSSGRTPWLATLDMNFAYITQAFGGKLTLQADVLNLLNSQKAVEFVERRDYSRAGSTKQPGDLNPNYLQPSALQNGRSFRLSARYEF
jgi:hypothetical protein